MIFLKEEKKYCLEPSFSQEKASIHRYEYTIDCSIYTRSDNDALVFLHFNSCVANNILNTQPPHLSLEKDPCIFTSRRRKTVHIEKHPSNSIASRQLEEYFAGQRNVFDCPIHFLWGTVLQKKVWEHIRTIDFGTTQSYFDVARAIGHPKAVRSVGTAVANNPIIVFIPCHRVIRKNKDTGQYRHGTDVKQAFLCFEQNLIK